MEELRHVSLPLASYLTACDFPLLHRKRSALNPNCVATGRQPPYTAPGETTLAPVPTAMELESPPSRSIPSLAPRLASVWNIKLGEICVPTAKNKSLRGRSTATAVRASGVWLRGSGLTGKTTLPSRSQKSCPPMPHFAIVISASVNPLSGRRWGVNWSSNHNKYVSCHT